MSAVDSVLEHTSISIFAKASVSAILGFLESIDRLNDQPVQ